MLRRLALASACILACGKQPDPGSDTSASSGFMFTSGDEDTLGMGVTSDPTKPPDLTDAGDAASSVTATVPSTDATSDPSTVPTITLDPSASVSSDDPSGFTDPDPSGSTDVDPTLPDTSSTTFDPNCPDPPNQPHSATCTDASGCGCASGRCFLIPILGGWCGECNVDADCPGGGCTIPDPVHNVGAACNDGEKGAGCMSDGVCNDPAADACATVLDVPGIITVATCGQCTTNADCPDQTPNCAIDYDIPHFSGVTFCAADKSIPNDGGCNLEQNGDASCASGHCGEANVMGLLKVGICGQCNSNADCDPGDTCSDPVVDLEAGTLIGAVCQ